jgi:hypothetical protein
MAQLIHEYHTHVRTPQGLTFVPRTYAERNADGVWEIPTFRGAFARAEVQEK